MNASRFFCLFGFLLVSGAAQAQLSPTAGTGVIGATSLCETIDANGDSHLQMLEHLETVIDSSLGVRKRTLAIRTKDSLCESTLDVFPSFQGDVCGSGVSVGVYEACSVEISYEDSRSGSVSDGFQNILTSSTASSASTPTSPIVLKSDPADCPAFLTEVTDLAETARVAKNRPRYESSEDMATAACETLDHALTFMALYCLGTSTSSLEPTCL